MNDEQTPALREAVENMANMREAYDNLSQAAEAYNTGKTELAQNITAKGVEASASESLPELAEKVSAIAQESYTIDGGEMYAKQLFGSLETPNYWNLYEVLEQLLSDGRLVNYGGILLAEYYRGYDSLALSGAGAGGAYVVSDKDENGDFIKYDTDIVHTWATEFDGKANRWVAYCFAEEYHNFDITDTNTSPRSIFIGRKVGTIKSLINGRISQIVVPDGNELVSFYNNGNYTQNFGRVAVFKMSGSPSNTILYNSGTVECVYIEADVLNKEIFKNCSALNSAILKFNTINFPNYYTSAFYSTTNVRTVIIECPNIALAAIVTQGIYDLYLRTEACFGGIIASGYTLKRLHLGYFNNDRTKSINFTGYGGASFSASVELQEGWKKPVNLSLFTQLTEENIVNYILNRLGDNTGQSAITITLGSTNLGRLTAEEKAIATNKGFILA